MKFENPIKKILVPSDFSEHANHALKFAVEIARKVDAELTVLTIIDYPGSSASTAMNIDSEDPLTNKYLQELAEKAKSKLSMMPHINDDSSVKLVKKVQVGNPFTHISDEVTQNKTDLVIMGTRGSSGLNEVIHGSNAERVVRHASCPVICIKSETSYSDINNIAFATSLIEDHPELIVRVKQLQELFGATIHIVSVNTPNNFRRDMTTLKKMDDLVTNHMFKDFTTNIYNDITEEEGIIYFAEKVKADMIAMGTHGRLGLAHLLGGSMAEDLVNHAKRPLWTFRIS